jgi:two-component system sensor histidine kinase VicK
MRIFWALAPFLVVLLAINTVYLPSFWKIVSVVLSVGFGIVIFFMTRRISGLNRAAKSEEMELRNIVSSLDDAVVGYSKDFEVLNFNPAAERLFGVPQKDIIGHKITPRDVQHAPLRLLTQVVFPSLAPVMVPRNEGNGASVIDITFDDPALELRVTTAPLRDDSGNLLGFVKIIRDRTREISLLKSKTEFITIASHQLRTPMTEISWALESLASSPSVDEQTHTTLDSTLKAARSLIKVTEDILNIAKIEEGRFGYKFQQADIADFVEKTMEQVLPLAKQAGISMYFDRPNEPLPPITIDPQKLSIVLVNLLENAVRYNTPKGEVTVRLEKLADNPFVKISVKDTGIGIPSEEIGKLFGKFFRADNAIKYQTRGSGLGLFIARNIVRSHGGQMGAESELNRGSVFYFTLPIDPSLIPPREVPLEG